MAEPAAAAAAAAAAADGDDDQDLERDLKDVGNKLLSPPFDVKELLDLLHLAESLLSRVEQEPSESMRTALYPVMKALMDKDLLYHWEKDIRVALASCFSEITIITSPVDPYDEDMMKDIFRIIVEALRNLDDLSSRTYGKKVSILETIVKVNTCVLMLDLECDDLILEMFHHFLKTISPVNAQRVFSLMEAIMTMLLNESEDKLLLCLLNSLLKDMKDASPIGRRLREKVIGNCAWKLKPYLINLVHSDGASYSDYGDIIASICQENFDTSKANELNTSDECLDSGRPELEVDCPKDNVSLEDKSSKTVLTNGRNGNCDFVETFTSLRQKPDSCCVIGKSEIATAAATEHDVVNSSVVVESNGIVDYNITKRKDEDGNSLTQLKSTSSHFQRDADKALMVPSIGSESSKGVDCPSGNGAPDNDQNVGERLPSEGTLEHINEKNQTSVGKPLGIFSYRRAPKQTEEAEKLCRRSTRRSTRKVFERTLLEEQKSKVEQQIENTIHEMDLAEEKTSKSYGETNVPQKKSDITIHSEEKDVRRISARRSGKKVAEMESSEHQKTKIEQLVGKIMGHDRPGVQKNHGETNVPLKNSDIIIDSEKNERRRVSTRRSGRTVAEMVSLEHQETKIEQLAEKVVGHDRSGEEKSYGEINVPLKNSDITIDSEEKNPHRVSTRRAGRKDAEMESSDRQKFKIEQLAGKVVGHDRRHRSGEQKVSEAESQEKELDEGLVGCKIKVWWPDDKKFYEGVVDSFDPNSKKHKVLYTDGDVEILLLKDERWKLLKTKSKPDAVWRKEKEVPRPATSQKMTPEKILDFELKQVRKGKDSKRDRRGSVSKKEVNNVTGTESRSKDGTPKLVSQRIDKMFEYFNKNEKDPRTDDGSGTADPYPGDCSVDNPSRTASKSVRIDKMSQYFNKEEKDRRNGNSSGTADPGDCSADNPSRTETNTIASKSIRIARMASKANEITAEAECSSNEKVGGISDSYATYAKRKQMLQETGDPPTRIQSDPDKSQEHAGMPYRKRHRRA